VPASCHCEPLSLVIASVAWQSRYGFTTTKNHIFSIAKAIFEVVQSTLTLFHALGLDCFAALAMTGYTGQSWRRANSGNDSGAIASSRPPAYEWNGSNGGMRSPNNSQSRVLSYVTFILRNGR